MRRWLAVLMLVMLPLQFSWAAVAGYCAHESDVAADHVGHHDHAAHGHDAKAGDAADPAQADGDKSASSDFDFDCSHCHGHCVGMVDLVPSMRVHAPRSALPHLGEHALAEPVPAQPERPQWAPLA